MSSNTEAQRRLAVVVVIDGLRASALGTYGNTTFPTPLLDDLSGRSHVIEWLLNTGPTLKDFYRGALSEIDSGAASCRLLTDDASAIADDTSGIFGDVLATESGTERRADEVGATHAAAFFSYAVEQLAAWKKEIDQHQRDGLLWIHFSGLSGPWDAPLVMREDLLDEDDPPAAEFVTPPSHLRGVVDPDELLRFRTAYAAQVSVIETCLAGFVQAFDELPGTCERLLMLAGGRGFSLGEHGHVGHDCQAVYSEQLHLPCLILTDETRGPLPRVTGFAQPADIGATIAHWLTGHSRSDRIGRSLLPMLDSPLCHLRDVVIATNGAGDSMIRTPAWLMTKSKSTELYAKPDDRWEANDVATRCPEIVDQLNKHMESLRNGEVASLAEELVSPWR